MGVGRNAGHLRRDVAVIGAGPCGLAAAKSLLDLGHAVTVFEADDAVGGNWRLEDRTGHASTMATTSTISSKRFSAYRDLPFPPDYPDYPSRRQMLAYFESYAERFALKPQIRFGHRVTDCQPHEAGGWEVAVESGGSTDSRRFDALLVCNGHHWKPHLPDLPGSFAGQLLHAHAVRRADGFAGERVLVVGGGNSACDCAIEISRVARATDLSFRRGYWILPKFMFGRPSDKMLYKIRRLPRFLRILIVEACLALLLGGMERYGLPKPDHRFGGSHPVINSELLELLRHGRIRPRPAIADIDGRTVRFADGSHADYDSIVAATGYEIAHPFLDKRRVDFSRGPVPLYLRMLPADLPGLYFIGLIQPLGPIWPAAELQARIAARHLAGLWQPPADLAAAIAAEQRRPDYRQVDTQRHTITVDYFAFRDRLLRELPEDWPAVAPAALTAFPSSPLRASDA